MALEFILERYNYWIVIVLMMTGLYIVFSRGNLIKKIVGLNIFQTSVFIYYITIGKIVDGTAPIIKDGHGEEAHEAKAGAHAAAVAPTEPGEAPNAAPPSAAGEDLHDDKISNTFAGVKPNELTAAPPEGADAAAGADSLHAEPGKIANEILREAKEAAEAGPSFDVASPAHAGAAHSADVASQGLDAAGHGLGQAAAVVYTNPLPHVLILTAIVVGVATTAVGLALAVRVREAYGTIEEDELEAADDIAEFGAPSAATAEAGA